MNRSPLRSSSQSAEARKSDPAMRKPPGCVVTPLLWSLIPMAAGILSTRSVVFGLAALVLPCALGALLGISGKHWLTVFLSYIIGMVLMSARNSTPHGDWSVLPPREARLVMRVTGLFNARKPDHYAGTGIILEAGIPHDTVSGNRVAFYLKNVANPEIHPGLGEVLECKGVLSFIPQLESLNDYQEYLLGRCIFLTLSQGTILRSVDPPPMMERQRLRLLDLSRRSLRGLHPDSDHPGRILASMLLGDRSLLSDQRIETFRNTGTFHLFAVSGLHVGSFAMCLHLIASLARIPGSWRIFPVLVGTGAYVWLTGSSPSAIRAGIMITCIGLSRHFLRQPHLFPAMSVSAMLVLLWNPSQLFDLGFQLSYGVVASIILVGLPMAAFFRGRLDPPGSRNIPGHPWKGPARRFACAASDLICISISASAVSMPLIVQHFHLFTPGGAALGVLLNPIASLTIMIGCTAMLTGFAIGSSTASWIALAAHPGIHLMEKLLQTCLRIPGAVCGREWSWPPTGTFLVVGMLTIAWGFQCLRQQGKSPPAISLFLPVLIVAVLLAQTTIGA